MLLSVIMPVFNETLKELHDSINSILNQTFKHFEFIIVDDNPKSNNIRKYLISECRRDYRIKLLFNKKNIGPSESMNKGVLYSKGNIIARMDADDISLPNRFYKQVHFINKYGLDFGCFNFSFINLQGHLVKRDCYSNISQVNQTKIRRIMSFCSIANGPSFMFKRSVFYVAGGYRARWIEDYDFASRVLISGFKVGYQASSLLFKRYRINSITNSNILKQFLGLLIISKYLRKYKYKKIVPTKIINNAFFNYNKHDITVLYCVKKCIYRYKKTDIFLFLIKAITLMFKSKLVLKFYLWTKTLGNRYCQNLLIK